MKYLYYNPDVNEWPHATGDEMRIPLFSVGDYDVYFVGILHWLELLLFLIPGYLLGGCIGMLIYYSILEPRKQLPKPGLPLRTTELLWVAGFLLPFWIFAPKALVDYTGVHNAVFRFSICLVTPTVSIFRTLEALFGFTPAFAQQSAYDFALYYGSPPVVRYDAENEKYMRATVQRQVMRHLLAFVGMLFLTGLYQSCFFLLPPHWFPTLGQNSLPEGWYSWKTIFDPLMWKDTLQSTFLNLFYLTTFCEGLAFLVNAGTGVQTERVNVQPLTASKSPSDFWGRRWNRLIHSILKGGVYKPVRSMGGSTGLAVLSTFFASGAFHEWLVYTAFPNYAGRTHGPTMFFFLWQAGLVAGEALIGHWAVFGFLSRNLPVLVRSGLVLLLGLPFGHFFCDPYVNSGFFLHGNSFFPVILPK